MLPRDARAWAQVLKEEWGARASSPRSRFYIASHPGWNDAEAWERQAEIDAGFVLYGLDPAELARMRVLEIGCGNGRLVPYVASRVMRYHGFDICPAYVQEARRKHAELDEVLFLEGDGACIPRDFKLERYDLIFAAAVFIHCPEPVIEAYLREAMPLLKPGGRLRFQVLADPQDGEGFVPVEALVAEAEANHQRFYDEVVEEQAQAAEDELMAASHYEGRRFRYREFLDFAASILPQQAELHIIRLDPLILNCEIQVG